jgi:CDP-diacylglycerol--glycerol-3-phosphate 3-phosphatidyltransferase/cardiolipin synthase
MDTTCTNERLGTLAVSTVIAARMAAAPLFVYTFMRDFRVWTLGVFLFAVFTDALDGYVGRRLGGSAFLGPYSDAIADFVLILTAFGAFVTKGVYPLWTLLLIVGMFAQFVLTSRRDRPIYDPVGKYYGVFLFGVIGVTLVAPHPVICRVALVGILGFTAVSLAGRSLFLLSLWKNHRER